MIYLTKKSKIIIFLISFIIILLLLSILYFLHNKYELTKYDKYDEIISFSDNKTLELVFYNISDNSVKVCYYKLNNSKNKTGEDIVIRENLNKELDISYKKFQDILGRISNNLNVKYALDENRIITYGGEKVIVSSDNLEEIVNIIKSL